MNKNPIIELSEDLKNKISAGEVVERPFSVVKELVENSLDAGATKIKVELIEGGIKKIIVTDNGFGMTKDEIPMALKRHATSKIKATSDLFYITSLGFRGEALPSIASVSHFTITSSTNELDGYRFEYSDGNLKSCEPSPMTIGTKVEVEDLFYNTPARLKHLGSYTLELSHITAYLNKVALAFVNVAFTLMNNGKILIQTLGNGNLDEIVLTTYGQEVAKNMLNFEGQNDLYHIKGKTTNNLINRSNRHNMNIMVNGRIIKNLSLQYAITDAYKTILPSGRYPVTILEIECDPSLVDVNVHPSKLEIRFTDENNLKTLISRTIYACLVKRDEIEVKPSQQPETLLRAFEEEKDQELSTESLWEMFDDAVDERKNNQNIMSSEEHPTIILEEKEEQIYQPTLIKNKHFFQNLTYIGQYNKTYLLMENEDNLYLIDQHAAMERFMYEKISREFSHPSLKSYELLIPIKLDYNLSSMILIKEKIPQLQALGIEIEEFGPTTIIVRALPLWIPDDLVVEYLRDIIDHFINNRKVNQQVMYDSLAKTLSCKKSIKANMGITELEVAALMKKLDECEFPYTCPHGRPTIIKFTKYEIEKLFKRVM